MLTKPDLTVIVVWKSSKTISNSVKSLGHAALEILQHDPKTNEYDRGSYENNTYVSFMPDNYESMGISNCMSMVKMKPINTYAEDIDNKNKEGEGRQPDELFCFHDLDSSKIIAEVKEFKNQLRYRLVCGLETVYSFEGIIRNIFEFLRLPLPTLPASKARHNCASIVLHLLRIGEFAEHYHVSTRDIHFSSVTNTIMDDFFSNVTVSPDLLIKYLKVVKLKDTKRKIHTGDVINQIYQMNQQNLTEDRLPSTLLICCLNAATNISTTIPQQFHKS